MARHTDTALSEARALDAARVCCARWGLSKVSLDDIATEAGVSRATLYRLFPGGKDTVLEALRQRGINEFFSRLRHLTEGVDDLEELLVLVITTSTRTMREDEHLALLLAAEPGAVNSEMSVEGMPRIIESSVAFLAPYVASYLPEPHAHRLTELLVRLVISYFLAPSEWVDLGERESASEFVRAYILPIIQPATLGS